MIKVQRIPTIINPTDDPLSLTTVNINQSANSTAIEPDAAIKQAITIVYDANGYPNINTIDLGMAYDHRVTWINFDLSNLLWHFNNAEGYTQDTINEVYNFKVVFKTTPTDTDSIVYVFDPAVPFEVPSRITTMGKHFYMSIAIQEKTDEEKSIVIAGGVWPGNIENDNEIFISAPIQCTVTSHWFNPTQEIIITHENTTQKRALTKEYIDATMTDRGTLTLSSTNFGFSTDRWMKYIRFDPSHLTAHVDNLTLVAAFRTDDGSIYYSLFEKTIDELDDQVKPTIAWIPSQITSQANKVSLLIFAYAGDIDGEEDEYVMYISSMVNAIVSPSTITEADLSKDPYGEDSNFYANDGDIVQTADNFIFAAKEED